jgi:hypothetical protein
VKVTEFAYFPQALDAILSRPGGGMDIELTVQGERVANQATDFISRQQPPRAQRGWTASWAMPSGTWAYNPPPGPPYMATGNLRDSIEVQGPFQQGDLPFVAVTIGNGETIRRGYDYAGILRDRGYDFVQLDDLMT